MAKTTTPVRAVEYWISPESGTSPVQVLQVKEFTTPPVTRPTEDTTCHEDTSADTTLGTPTTGTCSITILANLTDAAHIRMRDLAISASAAVGFAKGYADGTSDPTSWTSGAWVMPDTRSFLSFIGTLTNWREGTPIGQATTWQFDFIPTGLPIAHDKA